MLFEELSLQLVNIKNNRAIKIIIFFITLPPVKYYLIGEPTAVI